MATRDLTLLLRARDEASRELAKVDKAAEGLGSRMGAVGKAMAAGAAVGAVALVALGAKAISAASDFEESLNKVNVVFGESSSIITDFSKSAARNLGQSQQEALEAAGTFGNLFVSMGLGQKEAAKLATEIVTLGSDLASFNNIKPEEALLKLRAGLVGEAEPLRVLGVNINAAAVEEEALLKGLVKNKAELTDAIKVQARYSLILQQTKTAQGDFARTSTGMANSTRIIKATLSDLIMTIGQRLLPIVQPLITAFAQALPRAFDILDRAMEPVARFLGNTLPRAFETARGFILPFGRLFLDLGRDVMNGRQTIGEALSVIQDFFREFDIDVMRTMKDFAIRILDRLKLEGPEVVNALSGLITGVIKFARENGPQMAEELVRWIVGEAAPRAASALVTVVEAMIKKLPELIPALFGLGVDMGQAILSGILAGLTDLAGKMRRALEEEMKKGGATGIKSNIARILLGGPPGSREVEQLLGAIGLPEPRAQQLQEARKALVAPPELLKNWDDLTDAQRDMRFLLERELTPAQQELARESNNVARVNRDTVQPALRDTSRATNNVRTGFDRLGHDTGALRDAFRDAWTAIGNFLTGDRFGIEQERARITAERQALREAEQAVNIDRTGLEPTPPQNQGEEGFQTSPGQMRRIPGAFSQPVRIIAHGGEQIGRPPLGGVTLNINVASLVVREEADIQRIARQLEADLMRALGLGHRIPFGVAGRV